MNQSYMWQDESIIHMPLFNTKFLYDCEQMNQEKNMSHASQMMIGFPLLKSLANSVLSESIGSKSLLRLNMSENGVHISKIAISES